MTSQSAPPDGHPCEVIDWRTCPERVLHGRCVCHCRVCRAVRAAQAAAYEEAARIAENFVCVVEPEDWEANRRNLQAVDIAAAIRERAGRKK